jgi:hypothetical protein
VSDRSGWCDPPRDSEPYVGDGFSPSACPKLQRFGRGPGHCGAPIRRSVSSRYTDHTQKPWLFFLIYFAV